MSTMPSTRPFARQLAVWIAVAALPVGLLAMLLDRFLPEQFVIPLATASLLAWAPWIAATMAAFARREPKAWFSLLSAPLVIAPLLLVLLIEHAHQCGERC